MSVFSYRNGAFCAEALPIVEIAQQFETPFYCTSVRGLCENAHQFSMPLKQTGAQGLYRLSAKKNLTVLKTFREQGLGVSVANAGELARALEADFLPEQIHFHAWPILSPDDAMTALIAGVQSLTVRTLEEFQCVSEMARQLSRGMRLVVMVDPEIQSLKKPMQTAFALEDLAGLMALIKAQDYLSFEGLAFQGETYLQEEGLLRRAYERMAGVVMLLAQEGFPVSSLFCGSVLPESFFKVSFARQCSLARSLLKPALASSKGRLFYASGARLLGGASVFVSRVLNMTRQHNMPCAVIKAGCEDLPNVDAYEVLAARLAPEEAMHATHIFGFAGDSFGSDFQLPGLSKDDYLVFMQKEDGHNVRALSAQERQDVPEVLVSGVHAAMIRRRVAAAEQMTWETLPDWMGDESAA